MSAIATVYRSTDVGAPVLSGTPGAFAALLDAVLVDGYGAMPPLGWEREFSEGHKRVYRKAVDAGAMRCSFRFDDSGTRACSVSAFESMTDVDTGVNAFASAPASWQKSSAESSAARSWTIVGNDRSVYYFVDGAFSPTNLSKSSWFFGDLNPLSVTDIWCVGYSASYSSSSSSNFSRLFLANGNGDGMHLARRHDGAVVPNTVLTNRKSLICEQLYFGAQLGAPYPHPVTNGTVLSPVLLRAGLDDVLLRATLPGVWIGEHDQVHFDDQIYGGFADLPPETELLCKESGWGTSATFPRGLIDITNPWY